MTAFRFPNESDEYRAARDELLELEKDLRERGEAVARERRAPAPGRPAGAGLPLRAPGRERRAARGRLRELFGEHDSLLVYSMMFGPDWDAACPSCTSLVDAFSANYHPLSHHCAMAVVSAARPRQLRDWARFRGWKAIPVLSAAKTSYLLDYFAAEGATDATLVSMMNAFRRTPDGIFHTWGSELVGHPMENGHPRHVDAVWPFWNLLDMTPIGRGERSIPKQDYEHAYFTKNVFAEPD